MISTFPYTSHRSISTDILCQNITCLFGYIVGPVPACCCCHDLNSSISCCWAMVWGNTTGVNSWHAARTHVSINQSLTMSRVYVQSSHSASSLSYTVCVQMQATTSISATSCCLMMFITAGTTSTMSEVPTIHPIVPDFDCRETINLSEIYI